MDSDRVDRPGVSVVVPFAGTRAEGEEMLRALALLDLGPRDELIVADNSASAVLADLPGPDGATIVRAEGEGSPARARNAGALQSSGEWLLFLDSDCRPSEDLIAAYLAEPPSERCGLVAGRVTSDEAQSSLAARYADTRGVLDQGRALQDEFLPWAMTANLLVRREVWKRLGGFLEGILNGEDVDFCWRAQRDGWTIAYNPRATVTHLHRETVSGLLRQAAVRRASARWVHRRWREAPLPPIRWISELLRGALGGPVFALSGQRQRAGLKGLDAAVELAKLASGLRDNRAHEWPTPRGSRRPLQLWCDEFPAVSQTFVVNEARALVKLGHPVEVVAWRRPERPMLGVHDLRVRWFEDDTGAAAAAAMIRLALRRPLGCLRDLRDRRTWSGEESITPLARLAPQALRALADQRVLLHAHFAAGAALDAMRVARITGRPWTLTAHAYDIYHSPTNLATKLQSAELVTSGCDYTVRDLHRLAGNGSGKIERIVMGIDPERFRRVQPYPGGRTVLAVGRLVEKKGFVDLVRAVAEPALADRVDRVVIVGEGPLERSLRDEIERLDVGPVVELAGRREPDEVRALLESADVLAMPCVVARDGDRDSMPVVVKEALAMEVPVVVTDEVGLPEIVRPEFGRIVPPANPGALANAIAEILDAAPERRAEMGRAGRNFVSTHANVDIETARLSDLLERIGPG